MTEAVSLALGLLFGFALYHLLLVTGTSKHWTRRKQEETETATWGELETDQPSFVISDVDRIADARFGGFHSEVYDPEDYTATMQCPHDGGHDLTPGERVMVIENATAPDGLWVVCGEHVFEPRVWEVSRAATDD